MESASEQQAPATAPSSETKQSTSWTERAEHVSRAGTVVLKQTARLLYRMGAFMIKAVEEGVQQAREDITKPATPRDKEVK